MRTWGPRIIRNIHRTISLLRLAITTRHCLDLLFVKSYELSMECCLYGGRLIKVLLIGESHVTDLTTEYSTDNNHGIFY